MSSKIVQIEASFVVVIFAGHTAYEAAALSVVVLDNLEVREAPGRRNHFRVY